MALLGRVRLVTVLAAAIAAAGAALPCSALGAGAGPPQVFTQFVPDTIGVGSTSEAAFTLVNPNSTVALTGVTFSDALPSGLVVASPASPLSTCGGTVTAAPGSSTITLTGAAISAASSIVEAGSGTCDLEVEVQPAGIGIYDNTPGPPSSDQSGAGLAGNTATLTVNPAPQAPTLAEAFGATSIEQGASTSLTYTVSNPNAFTLFNVGFTDALPAGLAVATPNALAGTCIAASAGKAMATAGSSSVALYALTIGGDTSCTLTVNVIGAAGGVLSNPTGPIAGNYTDPFDTSFEVTAPGTTATLIVVGPPTAQVSFVPAQVAPGGSTALTFTIIDPNPQTALSGIGFSDTLPTGLKVSGAPSGSCGGGTITAAAGSSQIQLGGAKLAAAASCTFSVQVTAAGEGTYADATGAISANESPAGAGAGGSLSVATAPTVTTGFAPASIASGSSSALSLTMKNTNASTTLTGLAFSETLPSGLVVANPNAVSGGCGGLFTATPGGHAISLVGGSLSPGASCAISLLVQGTAAGMFTASTGPVTSLQSPASTGASATVTVTVTVAPAGNAFSILNAKGSAKNGVVTFQVKIPDAGRIDALESAANSLAHVAVTLAPGKGRFAFGRLTRSFTAAGTFSLRVTVGKQGKRVLKLHKNGFKLNLWVSYTPTGGSTLTHAVLNLRMKP